jgi:CBS domain containing-hemolysin-like protein
MDKIIKHKRHRFWLRLLFVAVAYIAPLVIIGSRYDFFQEREAGIRISAMTLIIASLLLFQFRKELFTWINEWEFSLAKIVLLGFAKVWAFVLALSLITVARFGISHIEYVVGWIAFPQIIAYLFVKPFAEQADHIVKRELRKVELKEALQEDRNSL